MRLTQTPSNGKDRTRRNFDNLVVHQDPFGPCERYSTRVHASFQTYHLVLINPTKNTLVKIGPYVGTSERGLSLAMVCMCVQLFPKPHRPAITCSLSAGVTTSRAEQSWPPSARAATTCVFIMPPQLDSHVFQLPALLFWGGVLLWNDGRGQTADADNAGGLDIDYRWGNTNGRTYVSDFLRTNLFPYPTKQNV